MTKHTSAHPMIKYIRQWSKFNQVMKKPDYFLMNATLIFLIIALLCGILY